jgi:hypothetical protein
MKRRIAIALALVASLTAAALLMADEYRERQRQADAAVGSQYLTP